MLSTLMPNIRQFGVELIVRRSMSAISKGESPGPEMAAYG